MSLCGIMELSFSSMNRCKLVVYRQPFDKSGWMFCATLQFAARASFRLHWGHSLFEHIICLQTCERLQRNRDRKFLHSNKRPLSWILLSSMQTTIIKACCRFFHLRSYFYNTAMPTVESTNVNNCVLPELN